MQHVTSHCRAPALTLLLALIAIGAAAQEPEFHSELVFPLQDQHVHGSTITELPGGGLLIAWFEGSGERWADDVRIMGARKNAASEAWSEPFLMADIDGFPDINPVLYVDGRDRLWLLWYTVLANQWDTSLLKYRISSHYAGMDAAPTWEWQADLHVKPGGKAERGIQPGDPFVESVRQQLEFYGERVAAEDEERYRRWKERTLAKAAGEDMLREGRIYNEAGAYQEGLLGYPYFRRMGWQSRSKPFITESGRMVIPLYSDGFSFSIMAYTDDWGETWEFSNPLVGAGNIQPTIAETESGELVAYMRDNGPAPKRLHVSTSADGGATWSPVRDSDLPNPGSAADIVTLDNNDWVLVYNDTERGRHSLAVALSDDDGRTWKWKRKLEYDETDPPRTGEYPSVIQGSDGRLHASYSYREPTGAGSAQRKSIKYVTFDAAWIREE